ncbi:MAG: integrase arm-type DNA-binding domain-containing protein, partial [Alphaproteobacteria bacterium]|nr:integrase arm-type DNA-binding domain-containing protein [Alphaproteobacteria bacterium]
MMSSHATHNKARKLTATAIARTNPPSRGQRDIPDTDPRGFGLRVSATGAKSFTFLFRAKSGPKVGKLQRLTLGRVPSTANLKVIGEALADAREQARNLRTEIERGGDPKTRLDAERRSADWHTGNTVEAVVRVFVEKHCKKKLKSHRTIERAFERHVLPKWGKRPITEIGRRDVISLLDSIA